MSITDLRQPIAVVIGLDCITGLQAARVLHRRGVRVVGIASDREHFAVRTRCVQEVVFVAPDGSDLLSRLRELATLYDAVLMPTTDSSVSFVARHATELAALFEIANSKSRSIERSLAKVDFAEHAKQHEIPIPATRCVEDLDDLRRAAAELRGPYVLKPDLKSRRWDERAGVKVLRAEDPADLERAYTQCRDWSERFVVQEWIDGGDDAMYSYYAFVAHDGTIVAECVGHKIRQWPRLTGSGTLSQICDDPEIRDVGRALLRSLGHEGFATVNMKRDPRTGRLFVIEANVGRPGMGMFVAEAAGLEMTYLGYRSLAGETRSMPSAILHPNARWVSLKRDFAAAFAEWRQGGAGPIAYLRSLRGVRRRAVFDLRDPMPFVHDLLRIPKQMYARRSASGSS